MKPIVNGLRAEYGDRVVFVQLVVRTPQGGRLLERYALRGHPAYVVVDGNGQVSWQGIGQVSEDALRARIEAVLAVR